MVQTAKKKKSAFLNTLDDYVVITIGVLFYTFAWADMLIPNGIASGGLTGACTIINFATGIPVYLSYIVVNGLLIIAGSIILGKGFGFKTLYAIGLSTLGLDFLAGMEFLHVFFDNKLLLVVVAAIIESIGITCILARGGSTGGTDIVALIVNKFWPVSLGKVFLAVDMFIIASVLLVPGKTIEDMVYGIILDAKTAEHSARMNSMKNATDNADEIIAKLQLLYNRARQSVVTNELIDIIGGANAIGGDE